MSSDFPGPKTLQTLERGIPLFRNGRNFHEEMEKCSRRGVRSVCQIVIDKAQGDLFGTWTASGILIFKMAGPPIR